MKTCKQCFRESEECEVDVVDVSLATELADYYRRPFPWKSSEREDRKSEKALEKYPEIDLIIYPEFPSYERSYRVTT